MISTLYDNFRHWSEGGSVFILSDLHFDDSKVLEIASDWIKPEEQLQIINAMVHKKDTFICLGDVGKAEYIKQIRAGKKVLLLGNHDRRSDYTDYFDEIYSGPLFIADRILLSHEPVIGLPWCFNIHGHDHNGKEPYREDCRHLNLAANVCGYTPVNLGKLIQEGILSDVTGIHRYTIHLAAKKKQTENAAIDEFVKQGKTGEESVTEQGSAASEELYIPSPEVRQMISDTGYRFSDRDKAAIVWNSDVPLQDKHNEIEKIAKFTTDENLKLQIHERLEYDREAVRCFKADTEGFVYAVNSHEYEGEDDILGYYGNSELAWKAGHSCGYAFDIRKYQVVNEDTKRIKGRVIWSPLVKPEPSKQIEEVEAAGFEVSVMRINEQGRVISYTSYELPKEWDIQVNTLSNARFENAYVNIPNPYHLCDRVRMTGKKEVGIVKISQKQWEQCVKKALEPGAVEDWFDASIPIEWNDGNHSHVNPIYLEREVYRDTSFYPVFLEGHAIGNMYWICPVMVADTDKITEDDVEKLGGEISIPDRYACGPLLAIFRKYFDCEMQMNKHRIYCDDGLTDRRVNGFGLHRVYNFYSYEQIYEMAYNIAGTAEYIRSGHMRYPQSFEVYDEVAAEIWEYREKLSFEEDKSAGDKMYELSEFLTNLAGRLMDMIKDKKEMIVAILAP